VACVIVNDACCLIDLRKACLLHAILSLPHRFVVPYPVRASELLDFTAQEWHLLDDGVTGIVPEQGASRGTSFLDIDKPPWAPKRPVCLPSP
jgi:hypothetical protein